MIKAQDKKAELQRSQHTNPSRLRLSQGVTLSKPEGLVLGISFIVLFALGYLVPYTNDDWAWGAEIGLARLSSWFANYNGRYMSNLLTILMSRHPLVRALCMATVMSFVLWRIYTLAGRNSLSTLALALTLLYAAPLRERAQTLTWTSGFTNYVVPLALVLQYLWCSRAIFEDEHDEPSFSIVLFLLAFISALMLETITLLCIFMSVVLLLVCFIKFRFWDKGQLSYLAGAALGAAWMFSNGAYASVAANDDSYRSLSTDIIGGALERVYTTFSYYLASYNWAVLAALLLILLVLALGVRSSFRGLHKTRDATHFVQEEGSAQLARLSLPAWVSVLICAGLFAFSVYCSFIAQEDPGELRNSLSLLAFMAFALLVLAFLIHYREYSWARMGVFLFACIGFVVAPLTVVNPVSPRTFFPAYVFEVVIVCMAWDNLAAQRITRPLLITGFAAALIMAHMLYVFTHIHQVEVVRIETINEAVEAGQSSIEIEKLPHSGYLQYPEPSSTNEYWTDNYKDYYGIPDETDIVFVESGE